MYRYDDDFLDKEWDEDSAPWRTPNSNRTRQYSPESELRHQRAARGRYLVPGEVNSSTENATQDLSFSARMEREGRRQQHVYFQTPRLMPVCFTRNYVDNGEPPLAESWKDVGSTESGSEERDFSSSRNVPPSKSPDKGSRLSKLEKLGRRVKEKLKSLIPEAESSITKHQPELYSTYRVSGIEPEQRDGWGKVQKGERGSDFNGEAVRKERDLRQQPTFSGRDSSALVNRPLGSFAGKAGARDSRDLTLRREYMERQSPRRPPPMILHMPYKDSFIPMMGYREQLWDESCSEESGFRINSDDTSSGSLGFDHHNTYPSDSSESESDFRLESPDERESTYFVPSARDDDERHSSYDGRFGESGSPRSPLSSLSKPRHYGQRRRNLEPSYNNISSDEQLESRTSLESDVDLGNIYSNLYPNREGLHGSVFAPRVPQPVIEEDIPIRRDPYDYTTTTGSLRNSHGVSLESYPLEMSSSLLDTPSTVYPELWPSSLDVEDKQGVDQLHRSDKSYPYQQKLSEPMPPRIMHEDSRSPSLESQNERGESLMNVSDTSREIDGIRLERKISETKSKLSDFPSSVYSALWPSSIDIMEYARSKEFRRGSDNSNFNEGLPLERNELLMSSAVPSRPIRYADLYPPYDEINKTSQSILDLSNTGSVDLNRGSSNEISLERKLPERFALPKIRSYQKLTRRLSSESDETLTDSSSSFMNGHSNEEVYKQRENPNFPYSQFLDTTGRSEIKQQKQLFSPSIDTRLHAISPYDKSYNKNAQANKMVRDYSEPRKIHREHENKNSFPQRMIEKQNSGQPYLHFINGNDPRGSALRLPIAKSSDVIFHESKSPDKPGHPKWAGQFSGVSLEHLSSKDLTKQKPIKSVLKIGGSSSIQIQRHPRKVSFSLPVDHVNSLMYAYGFDAKNFINSLYGCPRKTLRELMDGSTSSMSESEIFPRDIEFSEDSLPCRHSSLLSALGRGSAQLKQYDSDTSLSDIEFEDERIVPLGRERSETCLRIMLTVPKVPWAQYGGYPSTSRTVSEVDNALDISSGSLNLHSCRVGNTPFTNELSLSLLCNPAVGSVLSIIDQQQRCHTALFMDKGRFNDFCNFIRGSNIRNLSAPANQHLIKCIEGNLDEYLSCLNPITNPLPPDHFQRNLLQHSIENRIITSDMAKKNSLQNDVEIISRSVTAKAKGNAGDVCSDPSFDNGSYLINPLKLKPDGHNEMVLDGVHSDFDSSDRPRENNTSFLNGSQVSVNMMTKGNINLSNEYLQSCPFLVRSESRSIPLTADTSEAMSIVEINSKPDLKPNPSPATTELIPLYPNSESMFTITSGNSYIDHNQAAPIRNSSAEFSDPSSHSLLSSARSFFTWRLGGRSHEPASKTQRSKKERPKPRRIFTVSNKDKVTKKTPKDENWPSVLTPLGMNVEYFGIPRKAISDKREYSIMRLANGMKVLLIEDLKDHLSTDCLGGQVKLKLNIPTGERGDVVTFKPESDSGPPRAFLGLSVGVGSFSDGDVAGLAHFVEHLIFMGSHKYPGDNAFDSYIRDHGGCDNATTDSEYTTFFFICEQQYLERAMHQFCELIKKPQMKTKSIKSEREILDREFEWNKAKDFSRLQQLFGIMAKPGHVAGNFSWGNKQTLEQEIDEHKLKSSVRRFHERHYSASRMGLAVRAQMSVSSMEKLVDKIFSTVKNNNIPQDDLERYRNDPFDTPAFHRYYQLLPAVNTKHRELILTWALPSIVKHYRVKPLRYIATILSNPGKGSLVRYLEQKCWVKEFLVHRNESGFEENSVFTLFSINIQLTEDGAKNISEIIRALFAFIRMLQAAGPNKQLYHEQQLLEGVKFVEGDLKRTQNYDIETIAENLLRFDQDDVLVGRTLLLEYDHEVIKKFLDLLVAEKVNVILLMKDDAVVYDQTERWFGTKYTVSDIPTEWLESSTSDAAYSLFKLPSRNRFLTRNFDINYYDVISEQFPIKIYANETMDIWFKHETRLRQPFAFYCLYFESPMHSVTIDTAIMLDILIELLRTLSSRQLQEASEASLQHTIQKEEHGFKVIANGFNEKLPLIVDTILNIIMAIRKGNILIDDFQEVFKQKKNIYRNIFMMPEKLNRDVRFCLTLQPYYSSVNKHKLMDNVTLTKFTDFVRLYFDHLHVHCLIEGNATSCQTLGVITTAFENLVPGTFHPMQRPEQRVGKLKPGKRTARVHTLNDKDPTSVVTHYQQSGLADVRRSCMARIVEVLLQEEAMRVFPRDSENALQVECTLKCVFEVIGFHVEARFQSHEYSLEQVDERLETFINKTFVHRVKQMKSHQLGTIVRDLIQEGINPDVKLDTQVYRHFNEIVTKKFMFDRVERQRNVFAELSADDIKRFVIEHFEASSHGTNNRKLSVQIQGAVILEDIASNPVLALSRRRGECKVSSRSRENAEHKKISEAGESSQDCSKFQFQLIETKDDHSITYFQGFKGSLELYPLLSQDDILYSHHMFNK